MIGGVLWGLVASIVSVGDMMLYKQALAVSERLRIPQAVRTFLWNLIILGMLVPLAFLPYVSGLFNLSRFLVAPLLLLLVAAYSLSGIFAGILSQYAYSNEKVSVLAPFGEMGRILTIIAGYLFFSNASLPAFSLALLAGVSVLLGNVDFRKFSVNRYCLALAASGIFRAISAILIGYLVVQILPLSLVLADVTIASCLLLAFFLSRGIRISIPEGERMNVFRPYFWNDFFWLISYGISLFLIRDLGVVVSALLGMITLVLTLVASTLFLGDRPSRKNIFLALVVTGCISGGVLL